MSQIKAITGDMAVAEAMKAIEPDVVGVYPITPQTIIVEAYAEYVARGEVQTEFVPAESEHSAISICVGAAAAGARAMTCTSSQGLALMWEVLPITSGMRLPIVMFDVNRAISAPINIHCDHSDTMGARDTGWIQIYSENAQEAYDNFIQAVRIAEHPDVQLPAMVMMDGFVISHAIQRVEVLEEADVKKFVGVRKADYPLLDIDNPVTHGAFDGLGGWFMEFKKDQMAAMEKAKQVSLDIAKEYAKISGREYGLFEAYKLDDADFAIIVINSTAGTTKSVIDDLRAKGVKAGLLKIRMYRPFPASEIAEAIKNCKAVAVLDRVPGYVNIGGPLFEDVTVACHQAGADVPLVNYIYGLGGRDILPDHIRSVYDDLADVAKNGNTGDTVRYLNIKE
jgi:pyruvate ferredoxin oxidoreductase alpha subunit